MDLRREIGRAVSDILENGFWIEQEDNLVRICQQYCNEIIGEDDDRAEIDPSWSINRNALRQGMREKNDKLISK